MKKLISALLLLVVVTAAVAQKKKEATPVATPTLSPIEAKVAGLKKYDGYFVFYYDEKQDKIHLLIDKFDTEVLYIPSLTAAIGSNDIGLDRNQMSRERIVKFERRGPKVLMTEPNYFYRANTTSATERRAVTESFAQSTLWGFAVEAEENGKVLVDATDFFLQDMHDVAGRLRATQQGSYSVDKSRSAFYLPRTKNFPQNSEVEVTLTFSGQPSGEYIRDVTPTPTAVTVREHHSFVQLPDGNYKPRKFDPRAGYFNMSYYDYATPISESLEKRFITRHRLEKKDPSAAVSEAVKPIIYYMDPGAPEPIRSALIEGARWWNQAFEAAGYKNAFQVELLPEDADPMDVRYNVINWVHRSTRGWSYGNTINDPRTGEIIKGHVTLGSLRVRQDYLIAEGLLAPYEDGKTVPPEMAKMALARLRQLAAHEVGHTLGLAHAYSSSTEKLASVMDYPHPIAELINGKIDLNHAYDIGIGAFDKVSIAFGYQDFPKGTNEEAALNSIIDESLKNGLTFLSDQDARPYGSAHPYAHLWDNGANPADELNRVMEIRATALKNFGEKNIRAGVPMAMLEEVLVPTYFFHRYQAEAAVKIIGGLNYRYALRGDGQPVAELLTPEMETKALESLMKTVDPSALTLPENILKLIPPRALGYSRHRELIKIKTELTFDAVSLAETGADMTFSLLFHPARANRLVEHHARQPKLPGLEDVLDNVIKRTLMSTKENELKGLVQRSTQHTLLLNLARLARSKDASAEVKAIVWSRLATVKKNLSSRVTPESVWDVHYKFLVKEIESWEQGGGDLKIDQPLPPPPGMPIGECEMTYVEQH